MNNYNEYDDDDDDEFIWEPNKGPSKKQMDDLHRQITTGLRSTELDMGKEPSYDEEGHLLGKAISVPGTLSKPHPKPPSPVSDYFRSPSASDVDDNPGVLASDETRGENLILPAGVMQLSQTQLPVDAQFTSSNDYLRKYGTSADFARIAKRNEGVTVKNPKLKKMIREVIMEALVREFVGDPSRPPSPPTPAMRGKKRRPPQTRRTLTQKEAKIIPRMPRKVRGTDDTGGNIKREKDRRAGAARVAHHLGREALQARDATTPEVDNKGVPLIQRKQSHDPVVFQHHFGPETTYQERQHRIHNMNMADKIHGQNYMKASEELGWENFLRLQAEKDAGISENKESISW